MALRIKTIDAFLSDLVNARKMTKDAEKLNYLNQQIDHALERRLLHEETARFEAEWNKFEAGHKP